MTRLAPLALLLLAAAAAAAAADQLEAQQEAQEDEILLRRSKRRVSLGDDASYEYEEELDSCDWCGSDAPNTDNEHRAATVTLFSRYLEPGTCEVNKSPNFPWRYPHNIDHRWTYTTHPDSVITFTVPKGGIQKSRGCHRDKLVVVVKNKASRRCSQFYNFVRTSGDSATMYIRFATNHRIHWHGYTGTVCASEVPTTTTTTTPPTTTTTTTTTTTPTPILCDNICGNIAGYPGRISLGVAGTHYPWVVTLDIPRDEMYVRCSGYLISRIHVVTAAYCFYQQTPTGTSVTVRVTAGEYDLSQPEMPTPQVLYTSTIDIYPSFNPSFGSVHNMAVVTMPGEGFTLNTLVAPICLPDLTIHNDLVVGGATINYSGFGLTKNDEPLMNMSTVALTTCFFAFDPELICILMDGTSESPCHGDMGGAIHSATSGGKYYAVGTMNNIPLGTCPIGDVFVYMTQATNFYTSWINSVTGVRLCNQ